MKLWSLLAVCALLAKWVNADNLLDGEDFKNHWQFDTYDDAQATFIPQDGVGLVQVTRNGTEQWHVELKQSGGFGFSLGRTYVLSAELNCPLQRTLSFVFVGLSSTGHQDLHREQVVCGPNRGQKCDDGFCTYSVTYVAAQSFAEGRVKVEMGLQQDTQPFRIKSPSLEQVDAVRTPPPEGESVEMPCSGGADAWVETFRDEFDNDFSKWNLYNSAGHAGNGLRRPTAITLRNGKAVITANNVNGVTVSGGMSAKLIQTYGCYVSRIRVDNDPAGVTSAVAITWPEGYSEGYKWENDYYETLSETSREPLKAFFHGRYNRDNAPDGCDQQAYMNFDGIDATEWHTVAMEWKKDAIIVYIDGKERGKTTDKCYIPGDNVRMYPTMQLDAKNDKRMTTTVEMEIDFLRVYKQK